MAVTRGAPVFLGIDHPLRPWEAFRQGLFLRRGVFLRQHLARDPHRRDHVTPMKKILFVACLAMLIPFAAAHADEGGLTNSGGSLSGGTRVANAPGTLTIAGGTLTFLSADETIAINATFANSSTVEHCSGGGRGGHVTCSFTFTGTFSGTLTVNGSTQAINGTTSQVYGTDGVVASGTTGYNSAYTPFYFSNTGQILRSDDLNGTNLVSYGTQGSDVGQFYGAYGIAVDSAGRIYVADTYNARIVRIDDMNGTNWTSFGTYGSDVGQFNNPSGISVDPAGRIYVMDTGNDQLVRIDDMNGANWTTFSSTGSGDGQLAQYVAPVAFDSSGRIYVADTGHRPHVRMDDMAGVLVSSSQLTDFYGPYYVFGATPVPLPTPRPSAISFSPPTLTFSQNVGTTSATQTITITNFGGSPLNGLTLSASNGFSE